MAVQCFAGAFNTGTGAVSSTIDVNDAPFALSGVSAVIFFMNGRLDSTDAAGRATRWRGMGFAVGATDRRCQVSQDADAQAAHTGGSYHSDAACIASVGVGTATDGLMDFDSWLSNGFRLIVDDVMPRSYRVGYLIITGLTAAATGQWQDSGTTGDKVITTGLSFQPDCEILLSTTIDTTPPGGRSGNEMMGMGFAVSTTLQATLCGGADEGSATTDTDSYANDVECLSAETAAAGTTLATRFTFVSHNSNGFTLNQAIVPATIAWNHFLALQGGSYTVKSVLTQTDTTTDINTSALGFTPAGLLLLSAFKAEHAAGTMTVHDTWCMGAASGVSNRVTQSIYSQDGVGDTVVYTAIEHDEVYVSTTNAAIEGLMDVKTWSDPITFIMDDADPSQKFVSMLVIGNVASGVTVVLDTAILSAAGQALTVVEGAVTIVLDTAILTANGIGLTVSAPFPPTTIVLDTAILTANGVALADVVPGAVTKVLNTASLTAAGISITVVEGAVSTLLDTALLVANGITATISSGVTPQTVLLDTANITASGILLDVVPGNISIILDVALLSANGILLDVVPGSIAIVLDTAILSAAGIVIDVVPGNITTILDTAIVTATGNVITISAPVGGTILLDTATITAVGVVLDVVPGSITTVLDTATLTGAGILLDVVPGAVSLLLDTASITASGVLLDVVPGSVTILLDTGLLTAAGIVLSVSPGVTPTIVLLDTASLVTNGIVIDVIPGSTAVVLDTAVLNAFGNKITISLSIIFPPIPAAIFVVPHYRLYVRVDKQQLVISVVGIDNFIPVERSGIKVIVEDNVPSFLVEKE